MSKRGKEKKADNVEKRRVQMEEALECQALKQAAERQMGFVLRRKPRRCSFRYCLRYVDAACTICPYCGNALPENQGKPLATENISLLPPTGSGQYP
jgi:hypothetical protein